MSDSESIKKILELNQEFPSIVIDENADIIEANKDFSNRFENKDSLYNLFDRNSALLVKNSFIDVKAFTKIQRRKVQLELNESMQDVELIISPFNSDKKTYYFVVFFWHSYNEHLIAYPTIDDSSLTRKYKTILNRLDDSLPQTLIEKKNFQYELDIEKEPIFIKSAKKYIFVNNSFCSFVRLTEDDIKTKQDKDIFETNIAQKLQLAEEICLTTKNIIVIESTDYSPDDLQQKNRIIKFPILNFDKNVIATINFGTIEAKRNEEKLNSEDSGKDIAAIKKDDDLNTKLSDEKFAVIEYDPDNFKILNANNKAAGLYGYSIDELLTMDITDLCSPDDMQKLLLPQSNDEIDFKHIKKDGSIIDVKIKTEVSEVNKKKINSSIIKVKSDKSEYTKEPEPNVESPDETESKTSDKTEDIKEDNIIKENIKEDIIEKESVKETVAEEKPAKETSPFLSSLFHEILTPVNVILGFVQEIIDSIDKPTEEQEESAKIIKDNQQLLLQTMNVAVQYSQLEENKIPIKNEEFVLNKYLLDLKDSLSRISEKENTDVTIEQINEEIVLINDRQKLLAAVSYFLKSAIKIADTEKLNLAIFKDGEKVYFSVTDNEEEATEKFINDLVEIYDTENPVEKKNFAISPIAIRLARKLNEITNAKVEKKTVKNFEAVVISFPTEKEDENKTGTETITELEEEKIKTPFEKDEELEKQSITSEEETEIVEVESENDKNDIDETNEPETAEAESEVINNHLVEEGIVKDIEDEEEIANEEIVTEKPVTEEEIITEEIPVIVDEDEIVGKLSCLLIEDSVDSQLLFQTQMKDFKLLKIVSSFTEALPLIKKYKFDLVYVDINLKGQYNGLDALKIIRQFENYKTVPIIAVTAYPFDGDKEKFLQAGFTDYFRKPLLKENLLDSINSLFL